MAIINGGVESIGAIPRDAIKQTVIAGGSAGAHTVTGIKTRDSLVSVLFEKVDFTGSTHTFSDLTSEFSISAADTIDNTGGTDTTGGYLIVTYLSVA